MKAHVPSGVAHSQTQSYSRANKKQFADARKFQPWNAGLAFLQFFSGTFND
jgi:hypothetical protein